MRKLVSVLVVVAAVVGVAYGIAKGAMYYRVRNALETLVMQASPYGDLTYGSIDTNLLGQVAVHDVNFRPSGVDADVHVDQVHVAGPNAWFFIRPKALSGSDTSAAPPRLHVSAQAIRLPLDVDWSNMSPGMTSPSTPDGCAGEFTSDPELLKSLGLNELVVDADMGWMADERHKELSANFGMEVRGLQSVAGNITFADTSLTALQDGHSMPQLGGFDLSMRLDPKFGERLVVLCAKRRGVTPEVYRQHLIDQQRQDAKAKGVVLGPGLLFALDTFYRQWGEVKLVARPKSRLGVMSLAFLPPDRVVEQLGLNLRINKTLVTDLSFTLANVADGKNSGLAGLFANQQSTTKPRANKPRYRRRWRRVAPQTLPQYVSRTVRVYSGDQPVQSGILMGVSEGTAQVQQRVHGGHFTAYVPLTKITGAEVQVLVQVNPPKVSSSTP